MVTWYPSFVSKKCCVLVFGNPVSFLSWPWLWNALSLSLNRHGRVSRATDFTADFFPKRRIPKKNKLASTCSASFSLRQNWLSRELHLTLVPIRDDRMWSFSDECRHNLAFNSSIATERLIPVVSLPAKNGVLHPKVPIRWTGAFHACSLPFARGGGSVSALDAPFIGCQFWLARLVI